MATRRTRKSKTNDDIKPQRQKFIEDNNLKDFQPSKWQEEFIDIAANNRITFTDSQAGVGKAQPLHSKILTKEGWVEMGSISVGDVVRSQSGWTKVVGVFPQGRKEIVRFTFKDGGEVESCVDHLWTVRHNVSGDKSRLSNKVEVVMTTLDVINLLEIGGEGNISLPQLEEVDFESKTLPLDPYVLGVLLGDGGISTDTVRLTNQDEEVVEEFSKRLPKGSVLSPNKAEHSYSVKGVGKGKEWTNPVKDCLVEMGLMGKRSPEKFIPKEYLMGSVEQRYELIQGLLDTDGTVSSNAGSVNFCTTSKAMAESVREIILSLGGKSSITTSRKCYTYKGVKLEGLLAYIVSINVKDKSKLFKLSRKRDLVSNTQVWQLSRNISGYEFIGEEDCQCIMVEDPTSLYVTDDYLLTHNTAAALYFACKQYLVNPYLNIVIVRTPVEAGKDRIGFLPDDLNAKMEPHFASTRVLLEEFLGKGKVESDLGKRIHFKVPNYMLGSTVRNSIFIIDEAQQLEPMMLKLLLERIGDGTTAIVLGSTSQMYMSDNGGRGALKDAVDRFFKADGTPKFEGVGYYKYPLEAMMRDDIVKTVIIAYEGEDE